MLRAVILSIAALFGHVGCVTPDYVNENQVSQHIDAVVTVQVPTESWQGQFDAINIPSPPPWGFFGFADNYSAAYFPILTVPVGATITQVSAKIKGSGHNACHLSMWRMTDFEHAPQLISQFPVVSSAVSTVTTATVSAPVISLTKLYLDLRTSPVDMCQVMSIEATYTPGV